jgi:hypothetical protein
MKSENASALIDSFIWGKVKPTYAQVNALGLTTEEKCRTYVFNRWSKEVGPRGITIRTKKLWSAVKFAVYARPGDSIEGSLWRVNYGIAAANRAGELQELQIGKDHPFWRTLGSYDAFETLGWVIAANESEALMVAKVNLGPRAHSSSVSCTREGCSTWEVTKAKNINHAEQLRRMVSLAEESIRVKKFEIEHLECQISFLEVGATFDSNSKNLEE